MWNRLLYTLGLACLLIACGADDSPPEETSVLGTAGHGCDQGRTCQSGLVCLEDDICAPMLQWASCDPNALPPGYSIPADVQCAFVSVPLAREAPDGPTITLRVAIHRALGTAGTGIFQLAGGPGGTSVAQAGIIPRIMPQLRQSFDLVYIDQRGTGESDYLDCASDTVAGIEACGASYANRDLDHYLSADAADDIETIRKRLGYERIMLRGGSYGTRVGLEYARRYPERIEALVLDGTVPPDDDFFTSVIVKADRGVAQLIEDCAADVACSAQAPTLEADIDGLLEQAETSPRAIVVSGSPDREDAWLFKTAMKYFVEDWYWRFRMPRALSACARGDCAIWDGLLSELFRVTITSDSTSDPQPDVMVPTASQSSYVAMGLYMTVLCAEFYPNVVDKAALRALAGQQRFGDPSDALDLLEICEDWPVSPIAESQRKPVVSDVPVLLISGAIDFVTPPETAAHALQTLSNGHAVVVPDATHSAMVTPCGAEIITSFFYSGGVFGDVDTTCLETYAQPFE